jgi:methylase of polypeptide subunit release factors
MTIAIPNAYDEIIDFIAAGLTPTSLIAFQPSEAAKERVAELIFREKNLTLSTEEKAELDRYMVLEHLLRLAKVRAHQHLAVA